MTSTITVPDNFLVQGDTTSSGISGLRVQINLTYPNDPDLTATLYYDMNGDPARFGDPVVQRRLGSGINDGQFHQHGLRRQAGTPIQNGSAPFFATFNPQMPLSAFADLNAQGTWTLVIQNSATGSGSTGTFNGWSLSFQKPLPTTGLGEPGSDNISRQLPHLHAGPDQRAVEPGLDGGRSGGDHRRAPARSVAIAVDPSDPSGNTVYVAGASGGIWKTTNFLTTSPNGPTYIPLTDFGPTYGVNIGSITVFGRNNDPNQSIIIAATGEGSTTGTPARRRLLDLQDGGADLEPVRQHRQRRFERQLAADRVDGRDRDVRRHDGVQGHRRSQVDAHRPGDHLCRHEQDQRRDQWRHLAQREHGPDLVADAGRPGDRRGPRPGQRHGHQSGHDHRGQRQPPGRLRGFRGATVEVAGRLHEPQPGPGLEPDGRERRQSADRQSVQPTRTSTRTRRRLPTVPRGGSSWPYRPPRPTPCENQLYEGWLYAAVATPTGGFDGLFVTKDFGQNWTQVGIKTLPPHAAYQQAIPTNDITQPAYPITFLSRRQRVSFFGCRPDQSQYRLPGRLWGRHVRERHRIDPHRRHQHLGCPLPGRLRQLRQRRWCSWNWPPKARPRSTLGWDAVLDQPIGVDFANSTQPRI